METRKWVEMGAQSREATYPLARGLVLVDTSGNQIAPFFVKPDFNLSPGYLERGGWEAIRYGARNKGDFHFALDHNIDTVFLFCGGCWWVTPMVDLGGVFPVNRILFYTHPDRPELYIDVFTLLVNDGDPNKIDDQGNLLWEEVRQETENRNRMVDTAFPTRPVRYVSILPQQFDATGGLARHSKPWEVAELEVYGRGYVPQATYLSEILDISQVLPAVAGDQAVWGRLYWKGHKDEEAQVFIQTRTGKDADPNIYWQKTGRGEEISTLQEDGTPLTSKGYYNLNPVERGPVTYDTDNWCFWSPPYPFEQGSEGAPIISPAPRRYIQFRIGFLSTLVAGSRIAAIGFDFSKPPSARVVVAEIFPRKVKAAVDTTFTYFLRPTLQEGDRGFDSLEIETSVRPSAVRSVRIEGEAVDLTVYSPEIQDDRLIVHFPPFTAEDTQKLLEVAFDARVVKYETEFRGRIFDRRSDEVRQLVDAGDATNAYSGDGLTVTFPFTQHLISSIRIVPNPFTPNGDGINDQLHIAYAILNLTEAREVTLAIYDLAGHEVCQVREGLLINGNYRDSWNGQTAGGSLVPPGIYLYQLSVKADESTEHHSGLIGVVY